MADTDRNLTRTHLMLDERHIQHANREDINLSARARGLLDFDFGIGDGLYDSYNREVGDVETQVIDPEAPVKFLRLHSDSAEVAMIPWEEAEIIAETVREENAADD